MSRRGKSLLVENAVGQVSRKEAEEPVNGAFW